MLNWKLKKKMKKEENSKERVWDSPANENRSDLQFAQSEVLIRDFLGASETKKPCLRTGMVQVVLDPIGVAEFFSDPKILGNYNFLPRAVEGG